MSARHTYPIIVTLYRCETDHKHMQDWVKALLHLYRKNPCLYEQDTTWAGFEWMNANDYERSIFSFVRKSKDGKNNLLFVISFTPVERDDYRVGVPGRHTSLTRASRSTHAPARIPVP